MLDGVEYAACGGVEQRGVLAGDDGAVMQLKGGSAENTDDGVVGTVFLFSLFGGIAALLIATTSSLNGGWILSVQYFGYHVAISTFALSLLLGKEHELTFQGYLDCLKFLVGLALFAVYINSVLYDGVSNINFMYVVSPPQSGLPFLTEKYGWEVYICHYAFTVIFCVTLCYIKPIVLTIKEKCGRGKKCAVK